MKLTPCRLDVWSPRSRASRGAGTTPAERDRSKPSGQSDRRQ